MAKAITASFRLSSTLRVKKVFRHISVTGLTDGLQFTGSMPHIFTGLCLRRVGLGQNYHGVGDEGIPTRQIAEVIGRRSHVPVVAKSLKESSDHFGWIGHFFGIDAPASSALTRERLGWQPKQSGLLADVDQPYYFHTLVSSVA
jgi:hypothetical protein